MKTHYVPIGLLAATGLLLAGTSAAAAPPQSLADSIHAQTTAAARHIQARLRPQVPADLVRDPRPEIAARAEGRKPALTTATPKHPAEADVLEMLRVLTDNAGLQWLPAVPVRSFGPGDTGQPAR